MTETEGVWWVDGPKLRSLRVARELSMAQLARQARIGQSTLSRLERSAGPGRMTWPPMVVALAAELGVPAEQLIGGEVGAFRSALGERPR